MVAWGRPRHAEEGRRGTGIEVGSMVVDEDDRGGTTAGSPARRLQDLMDRLLAEYSDRLAPGIVVHCVARSTRMAAYLELDDSDDLVLVVEQLARQRLDGRLGRTTSIPAARTPAGRSLTIDLRDSDLRDSRRLTS